MPSSTRALAIEGVYRQRRGMLWRRSVDLVRLNYRRSLDLGDVTGTFAVVGPMTAAVISQGQAQAAGAARGYLSAYVAAELGEAVGLEAPVPGNVGATADGRALQAALAATPAKMALALKMGRAPIEVARFGEFSLSRLTHTEIVDASRIELGAQMDASPVVKGWRWASRGARSCPACLSQDSGRVRAAGQSMNGHAGCDCVEEPVVDGVEETVMRPTAPEVFDGLSPAEQDAAFGSERAELLRSGQVGFEDLSKTESHEEWRPTLARRTVEELKGAVL